MKNQLDFEKPIFELQSKLEELKRHPEAHSLGVSFEEEIQKIEAKIATLQCPCPSRYSVEDAARDEQTLARLWRRRRSRAKLTARQDTALAHINARYAAYAWGPEAHGRTRLTALREKRRVFRMAGGPGLSSYERAELRGLATLYPPELFKIDEDCLARESALATLYPPDFHPGESTFEDFEEFVEGAFDAFNFSSVVRTADVQTGAAPDFPDPLQIATFNRWPPPRLHLRLISDHLEQAGFPSKEDTES